jgi:hypothetical protein
MIISPGRLSKGIQHLRRILQRMFFCGRSLASSSDKRGG